MCFILLFFLFFFPSILSVSFFCFFCSCYFSQGGCVLTFIFLISVFFFQEDLFYPCSFSFLCFFKKNLSISFSIFFFFPLIIIFFFFSFSLEDVAIPGIFFGRKFTIFLKEKKVPSSVFFLAKSHQIST